MRYTAFVIGIGLGLASAACGSDGGSPGGTDAPPGTPDALPPGTPDAAPDAMPTPYGCLGKPLPTTAPATIKISGVATGLQGMTPTPESGVAVALFVGASGTATANAVTDAQGKFDLSVTSGGKPVDLYLRARKLNDMDMYLYPSAPIDKDVPSSPMLVISSTALGFLGTSTGVTQSGSKGFVTVVVVDCLGNPVSGATITASPSNGETVRYVAGTAPSMTATETDASGTAMIFNAPTGDTMIGASAGGMTLRAHTLNVRAGAITGTVVQP
jgi:hypothetical protein